MNYIDLHQWVRGKRIKRGETMTETLLFLVESFGERRAWEICDEFGGQRIHIGVRRNATGVFYDFLSDHERLVIFRRFTFTKINIPARKSVQVVALRNKLMRAEAENMRHNKFNLLATRYSCCESTARTVING